MKTVTVVIPALNEEEGIGLVLKGIRLVHLETWV